jgi:epoxyqueuosine reductase QueG
VINGFGKTHSRPANKVFHSGDYRVAWGGLERYFHAHANDISIKELRKIRWHDRYRDGKVATEKFAVENRDEMSEYVAICIAVTMELDGMQFATTDRASAAILDGYSRASRASVELAKRIRGLGWEALAASNVGADTAEVLHLPLAVQAGLGQLGKHGSLITKEFGSNLRLATILTNMPLSHDQPIDIGVDDFCGSCQIWVANCPPQAIFDSKQVVRGVEKRYVDFDKCIPYFSMHNSCGVCVAVCPWTEPGRGESISLKMLANRTE